MRINPVSIFKPNACMPLRNEKIRFGGLFNRQPKDTFVRQNKFPYGEIYSKALNNFTKDASNYIMNSPKITYEGLYNVVKNYSEGIDIDDFDSQGFTYGERATARYNQFLSYGYTPSGPIEIIKGQAIYVNIPKNPNSETRSELLGEFVHETVHMFQDETRVKVSGESFLNHYLRNTKSFDDFQNRLMAIGYLAEGYSNFEENMLTLMENYLNLYPNKENPSVEDFNRFLVEAHSADLDGCIKILIENAYRNTGADIIDSLGSDSVIEYIKYEVGKETEAYTKQSEVIQKYSQNQYKKRAFRLMANVYGEILKNLEGYKTRKAD